eukprot:scaffold329414_cov116-Tisochrysis_lutea.AAC.1
MLAGSGWPRQTSGIWHAAGVLSDGLLAGQSASSLRRVYAPKVSGGWYLHQESCSLEVGSFMLYSSVAALLGGRGQANYSAANSCLDSLSGCRRSRGLSGASLQWGPWADVGMAAGSAVSARLQAGGVGLISAPQGLLALQAAMRPPCPSVLAVLV